jgi:hypothetical protein
MKFKKDPAFSNIFQGTRAQLDKANGSWPRRMLMNPGNGAVRSLAAESEFADMLTPRAASRNEQLAKKRQALFVHFDINAMGFQYKLPYRKAPAEEAAIPMKEMRAKMMESIGT